MNKKIKIQNSKFKKSKVILIFIHNLFFLEQKLNK